MSGRASAPSLSSSSSLRLSLRENRRKAMFSSFFPCLVSKPKEKEGGNSKKVSKPKEKEGGNSKKLQKHSVILNIYDAPRSSSLNRHLYNLGLGRYFSTVVVHNSEYVFMADTNGIRRSQPSTLANEKQLMLRKTIVIGYTDKDDEEVQKQKDRLGMVLRYGESTEYNGISRNCNHFSDEFCRELTGKGIPKWVNRIKYTTFIEDFLNPPTGLPLLEPDVTL